MEPTKNGPVLTLFGLEISATRTFLPGFLVLAGLLAAAGYLFFDVQPFPALLTGLAGALAHTLSETWHQLGHAAAAKKTGYPMKGIRFWFVLGASVYPEDEPALPGSTHIRRALGGPPYSFALALAALLVFLLIPAESQALRFLAGYVFLANLFIFSIAALLPLGFTDGSTLIKYWATRNEN